MLHDINSCKDRIQKLLDDKHFVTGEDVKRARSFIHILRVLQAEVCCLMKDWRSLLDVIHVRLGIPSGSGRKVNLVPRTRSDLMFSQRIRSKHSRTCW